MRPIIISSSDQKLDLATSCGFQVLLILSNIDTTLIGRSRHVALPMDEVPILLSTTLGLPQLPRASPLSPEEARFPWSAF
jgi:hypothetical protein